MASILDGREQGAGRDEAVAVAPGELAWIAALPCALVTLAGIVLLGPVVGDAFLAPGDEELWPRGAVYVFGTPEPAKHGRYVMALLGPLLLAAAVLAGGRRELRLPRGALRALVATSQLALVALLVAAIAAQRDLVYEAAPAQWAVLGVRTLVAAPLLVLLSLVVLRRSPTAGRVVRRPRETRALGVACFAVAACATAVWLLTAVNTDRSIGNGPFPDLMPWATGDTYAILDGRTPLVDFHALYGQLWAYVAAVPMALLGSTIAVFTITMVTISGVALAIYAVFRRVVRSAPLALALYLPFLAAGLVTVITSGPAHATNAAIFSVWPMRYAGPYLLAWLTARHLDGAAPRRAWLLSLAGGLVIVNNLEFGLGALAGTLAALVCARPPQSWRAVRQLAGSVAAGLLAAALLVSALTLVRSGSLPRPGLLLEFPRLFGVLGLTALPLSAIGFHLVLYATFAAAIVAAAVRVAADDEDRLLTGMLVWSGVFGLLAGSYFMGRSDPLKLAALFSAWCLALALLVVSVVRSLAAREWRRPAIAELTVLLGFGLAAGSLVQLPAPWTQLTRARPATAAALYEQVEARGFVDRHTQPGEQVVILIPMGHRIAHALDLTNVSPYGLIEQIATRRQLSTTIEALHDTHAHKLFVLRDQFALEQRQALTQAGFGVQTSTDGYAMWSNEP